MHIIYFCLPVRTLHYFCRVSFHTETLSLSSQKFFYSLNLKTGIRTEQIRENPPRTVIEIAPVRMYSCYDNNNTEGLLIKVTYIVLFLPQERNFGDASKEAVFPFTLLDNFLKRRK
jgi:hypothetical protein